MKIKSKAIVVYLHQALGNVIKQYDDLSPKTHKEIFIEMNEQIRKLILNEFTSIEYNSINKILWVVVKERNNSKVEVNSIVEISTIDQDNMKVKVIKKLKSYFIGQHLTLGVNAYFDYDDIKEVLQ